MSIFEQAIALGGKVPRCDAERNLTKMALRVVYGTGAGAGGRDEEFYWAVRWLHHARSYPPTLAFVLRLLDAAAAAPQGSRAGAVAAAKKLVIGETMEREAGNELQRVLIIAHVRWLWSGAGSGPGADAVLKKAAELLAKASLDRGARVLLVERAWAVMGRDEAAVRSRAVEPKDAVMRLQDCVSIIMRCGGCFRGASPGVVAARVHLVRRLCSIARTFFKADPEDTRALNTVVCLLLSNYVEGDSIEAFCLLTCCVESISMGFRMMLVGYMSSVIVCSGAEEVLHCANDDCRNLDGESELSLVTYPTGGRGGKQRVCSERCWLRIV